MNPDLNKDSAAANEEKELRPEPKARGGVTVVFFAAAIILNTILLRNFLSADISRLFSVPYVLELIFQILMVVGCVICLRQSLGWRTNKTVAAVFIIYVLYVILNACFYSDYMNAYLTGFDSPYESTAGALVALKCVLVLIGIIAGLPTLAKIDSHEYAERLRQKVELQNAAYAKESAENSKKELDKTIERLKSTMSEAEIDEFISRLKEKPEADSKGE